MACVLSGLSPSAALAALASLAIMLPKSRMNMLNVDGGALMGELLDVVYEPKRFTPTYPAAHALEHNEAHVIMSHLLGNSALALSKLRHDLRL